jgi:hypothetical protein
MILGVTGHFPCTNRIVGPHKETRCWGPYMSDYPQQASMQSMTFIVRLQRELVTSGHSCS